MDSCNCYSLQIGVSYLLGVTEINFNCSDQEFEGLGMDVEQSYSNCKDSCYYVDCRYFGKEL